MFYRQPKEECYLKQLARMTRKLLTIPRHILMVGVEWVAKGVDKLLPVLYWAQRVITGVKVGGWNILTTDFGGIFVPVKKEMWQIWVGKRWKVPWWEKRRWFVRCHDHEGRSFVHWGFIRDMHNPNGSQEKSHKGNTKKLCYLSSRNVFVIKVSESWCKIRTIFNSFCYKKY